MTPPENAIVVQELVKRRGLSTGKQGCAPGQSEIRQFGDIAWVSLSRGLWATIDAADIPRVAGLSWYAGRPRSSGSCYAISDNKDRKKVRMHRLILDVGPAMQCDHRDCDSLNNRRANLRECTLFENARNRKIAKRNASGFKGVVFHPALKKWRAVITADHKRYHLGCFETPEEAHVAYVHAAQLHHGEFGRAN